MKVASSSRVRVRYAETDAMGVMHHAVWTVYWELGRADWLRARGRPYSVIEREDGVRFPVIAYGVEILLPLRYDDEIEIRTSLADLGRVKLRFEYEGRRGEELIARGYTLHGVVDRDWRIRRLPDALARCLGGGEGAV